jgi:hypothetical protein
MPEFRAAALDQFTQAIRHISELVIRQAGAPGTASRAQTRPDHPGRNDRRRVLRVERSAKT